MKHLPLMHIRTKIISFVLTFMILFVAGGCAMIKKSKVEKAEISEAKEIAKANTELRARQKAHYKRQSPDTKKMMKRSKRHAKKLNRVKKTL